MYTLDCIDTLPIVYGYPGKMAIALKVNNLQLHAIPQFKPNEQWHAMVLNFIRKIEGSVIYEHATIHRYYILPDFVSFTKIVAITLFF